VSLGSNSDQSGREEFPYSNCGAGWTMCEPPPAPQRTAKLGIGVEPSRVRHRFTAESERARKTVLDEGSGNEPSCVVCAFLLASYRPVIRSYEPRR
jgi:hypothetical protein